MDITMAALIFPGIVTVDPSKPYVGVAGAAVAAFLAWRKLPVMACVCGAILTVALLSVDRIRSAAVAWIRNGRKAFLG